MPLSRNTSGVVVVDDTSRDITYQGRWFRGGVSDEFLSTTHGTWQSGSTAKFSFRGEHSITEERKRIILTNVIGSAVTVYGTVITGCRSAYALDDSSPVTFTAPNQTSIQNNHQFPFYSSPTLQDGVHTLTITQLTNNSNQVLWLDYIVYRPSPVGTSTNGVRIATIVGYIGGGLLAGLLLSAIIFTLLWRRCRRRLPSGSRTHLLAGKDGRLDESQLTSKASTFR